MNPPRRILLVEGPNDKHVLWALLKHHAAPETFSIQEISGVDKRIQNARVRLKALRTAESMERLGIILDADEDQIARWRHLRAAVRDSAGVELPAAPARDGTVVKLEGDRSFGAWLMPNNQLPGKLEDFLSFLVPRQDTLLPLVERFLDGLPSRDCCPARFPDKDRIKACIHSWLAVQDEPGKPMGAAITARYLYADAPMAAQLVAWLRRLFVD
jgi:hypothetical protein